MAPVHRTRKRLPRGKMFIRYRAACRIRYVDALSRNPVLYAIPGEMSARIKRALSRNPVLYAVPGEMIARIKRAQCEDEGIRAIIQILKERTI